MINDQPSLNTERQERTPQKAITVNKFSRYMTDGKNVKLKDLNDSNSENLRTNPAVNLKSCVHGLKRKKKSKV